MKLLSAFILMHLRFYKRPVGRPWLYDIFLMYSGVYAFLLSNVVGVYKAWPQYEDLTQKMIGSRKRVRPEAVMDETELDDFKCYFYQYDMAISRYF